MLDVEYSRAQSLSSVQYEDHVILPADQPREFTTYSDGGGTAADGTED